MESDDPEIEVWKKVYDPNRKVHKAIGPGPVKVYEYEVPPAVWEQKHKPKRKT